MLRLPGNFSKAIRLLGFRIMRVVSLLLRPLQKISAADIFIVRFLNLWLTSRGWRHITAGIPAVLIFAVSAIVLSARHHIPDAELALHYRIIADKALAVGDENAAALWMKKVAVLAPNDPDILYNQALVAADHGDRDTARSIMQQLAAAETSSSGRPELWLAMDLVQHQGAVPAEQVDAFRDYLTIAVERHPEKMDVREMLMQLEFSQGHQEAGIDHLKRLTKQDPRFALPLARSLNSIGSQYQAVATAQTAVSQYVSILHDDASNLNARIHLANLYVFLNQFESARGLLEVPLQAISEQEKLLAASPPSADNPASADDATTLADARERLRLELSAILVQWADAIQQLPDSMGRRLELLQDALNLSPHDPRVLESVAMLAAQQNEGAVQLRDQLNDVLAQGRATPITHLILSMGALGRGDRTAEEHHLRLALAGNPNMPIAANNLAMLLSQREPPATEEALELVNHALSLDPDHPEIRATRGTILGQADRIHEAIIDLEFALSHLRSRPDLHTELSRLYQQINDDELAARHRTLADKAIGSISTVTREQLHDQ